MLGRALLLLALVGGASAALTWWLGADVLLALGLILTQLKVVGKKILAIPLPAVLQWLKSEAAQFFRIELLKKWILTSWMPLLVGAPILRRVERFIAGYTSAVRASYDRLIGWYRGLAWYEQVVAALIVLSATLALAVSSLGLWLVLFSVQLPFWIVAALSAAGRMTWSSLQKTVFKTLAFLQLGWLWRFIRRLLPQAWLARKRRFDFRVARMVVRQRRLTWRQLEEQRSGVALRWAFFKEYIRQWRSGD